MVPLITIVRIIANTGDIVYLYAFYITFLGPLYTETMDEKELLKVYRVFYVLGDTQSLKILHELGTNGERTFSELRDILHINPATLSKRLKTLTQVELITPDTSHDRLRVFYSLHLHQRSIKRILDSLERLAIDL